MRTLFATALLMGALPVSSQGRWDTYSHFRPDFTIARPVGWEMTEKDAGADLQIGDATLQWQAEVGFAVVVEQVPLRISTAVYKDDAGLDAARLEELLTREVQTEAEGETEIARERVRRVACVRAEHQRGERTIVETYMPAKGHLYVIALDVPPQWIEQCWAGYEHMVWSVKSEALRAAQGSPAQWLRDIGLTWRQIQRYTGRITPDGRFFWGTDRPYALTSGKVLPIDLPRGIRVLSYWPTKGLFLVGPATLTGGESDILQNVDATGNVVQTATIDPTIAGDGSPSLHPASRLSQRPSGGAICTPQCDRRVFSLGGAAEAGFVIIHDDLTVRHFRGIPLAYVSMENGVLLASGRGLNPEPRLWLDGGDFGRRLVWEDNSELARLALRHVRAAVPSPDGTLLALETKRHGLELVDLSDMSSKVIVPRRLQDRHAPDRSDPAWSTDSSLVYTYNAGSIYTREGELVAQLPMDWSYGNYSYRGLHDANWSPTRNEFARLHTVCAYQAGGDQSTLHTSLCVWSEDDGAFAARLPPGAKACLDGTQWSPDGEFVSLQYRPTRGLDTEHSSAPWGLMLVRRDLSEAIIFSYVRHNGDTWQMERSGWTPDAEWLMVAGLPRSRGLPGLVRFRLDGTAALQFGWASKAPDSIISEKRWLSCHAPEFTRVELTPEPLDSRPSRQ